MKTIRKPIRKPKEVARNVPPLSLLPLPSKPCHEAGVEAPNSGAASCGHWEAAVAAASTAAETSKPRRILAITFPRLLLELARIEQADVEKPGLESTGLELTGLELTTDPWDSKCPHAVVLVEDKLAPLAFQSTLDAVNAAAHKRGISPGFRVAEGLSLFEGLCIHKVSRQQLVGKLKQFANVAVQWGSPISFAPPDTIWVDITGSSHLFGGEQGACSALSQLLTRRGHCCRIAISSGPWSAQAFARFRQPQAWQAPPSVPPYIVDPACLEREIGQLPIRALPLSLRALSWLKRLGLHAIGDLRKLPQAELLVRLKGDTFPGTRSFHNRHRALLEQIQGRDPVPLHPYQPTRPPEEQASWDEPIHHVAPLLLQVESLIGCLSKRLEEGGQAIRQLALTLTHDRAIARYRNCPLQTTIQFSLTTPMQHVGDLLRIVRIRLERYSLLAPVLAIGLRTGAITVAPQWQLSLNSDSKNTTSGCSDPQALQLLFAELVADLGANQVGVLVAQPTHLLEKRSVFRSITSVNAFSEGRRGTPITGIANPTRWLDPPIGLRTNLQEKSPLPWQGCTYQITRKTFLYRLENVEWWRGRSICRDYYRLWLTRVAPGTGISLLAFLDRNSSKEAPTNSYIHALFD